MKKKILLINGPNLARLGKREQNVYGNFTLRDVESVVQAVLTTATQCFELSCFQSDSEAELIHFIDEHADIAGAIINPGALMIAGWSFRDALADFSAPWIEVHISNIFSREIFRHESILAAIADGFIAGCGIEGYRLAAQYLLTRIK